MTSTSFQRRRAALPGQKYDSCLKTRSEFLYPYLLSITNMRVYENNDCITRIVGENIHHSCVTCICTDPTRGHSVSSRLVVFIQSQSNAMPILLHKVVPAVCMAIMNYEDQGLLPCWHRDSFKRWAEFGPTLIKPINVLWHFSLLTYTIIISRQISINLCL